MKEALVDDPDEMFQLADLLDGVSVDGVDISTESDSPGRTKENVPTMMTVSQSVFLLKFFTK